MTKKTTKSKIVSITGPEENSFKNKFTLSIYKYNEMRFGNTPAGAQ